MTCLLPISQASVWRQHWTRFLEFEQGLCYWISACYGASNFPSLGLSFLTYNSRRFDWIGVLGLWNPRKSTDGVQMSKESPRICMQKILCLWLKGPLDFSIFKGTHYHSKISASLACQNPVSFSKSKILCINLSLCTAHQPGTFIYREWQRTPRTFVAKRGLAYESLNCTPVFLMHSFIHSPYTHSRNYVLFK